MRLDANGAPLDAVPIDIATSAANEHSPFVTANGSDFLVLYRHEKKRDEWAQTLRQTRARLRHTRRFHATEEGSLVTKGNVTFSAEPMGDGYIAVYAREDVKIPIEAGPLTHAVPRPTRRPPLGGTDWWPVTTAVGGRWLAYARTDPSLGNIPRVFVRVAGEDGPRRRAVR